MPPKNNPVLPKELWELILKETFSYKAIFNFSMIRKDYSGFFIEALNLPVTRENFIAQAKCLAILLRNPSLLKSQRCKDLLNQFRKRCICEWGLYFPTLVVLSHCEKGEQLKNIEKILELFHPVLPLLMTTLVQYFPDEFQKNKSEVIIQKNINHLFWEERSSGEIGMVLPFIRTNKEDEIWRVFKDENKIPKKSKIAMEVLKFYPELTNYYAEILLSHDKNYDLSDFLDYFLELKEDYLLRIWARLKSEKQDYVLYKTLRSFVEISDSLKTNQDIAARKLYKFVEKYFLNHYGFIYSTYDSKSINSYATKFILHCDQVEAVLIVHIIENLKRVEYPGIHEAFNGLLVEIRKSLTASRVRREILEWLLSSEILDGIKESKEFKNYLKDKLPRDLKSKDPYVRWLSWSVVATLIRNETEIVSDKPYNSFFTLKTLSCIFKERYCGDFLNGIRNNVKLVDALFAQIVVSGASDDCIRLAKAIKNFPESKHSIYKVIEPKLSHCYQWIQVAVSTFDEQTPVSDRLNVIKNLLDALSTLKNHALMRVVKCIPSLITEEVGKVDGVDEIIRNLVEKLCDLLIEYTDAAVTINANIYGVFNALFAISSAAKDQFKAKFVENNKAINPEFWKVLGVVWEYSSGRSFPYYSINKIMKLVTLDLIPIGLRSTVPEIRKHAYPLVNVFSFGFSYKRRASVINLFCEEFKNQVLEDEMTTYFFERMNMLIFPNDHFGCREKFLKIIDEKIFSENKDKFKNQFYVFFKILPSLISEQDIKTEEAENLMQIVYLMLDKFIVECEFRKDDFLYEILNRLFYKTGFFENYIKRSGSEDRIKKIDWKKCASDFLIYMIEKNPKLLDFVAIKSDKDIVNVCEGNDKFRFTI